MVDDVTSTAFCSASGVFDVVGDSSSFLSSGVSCALMGVTREFAVSVTGFGSSSLGTCNNGIQSYNDNILLH